MNVKRKHSIAFLFGVLPFLALAQTGPVPGQPASIVIHYFDPATGEEVNVPGSRYIQPDSTLHMQAEVLDGYGQPADLQQFPCTVQYEAWNNFAGSRQSGAVQGNVLTTSQQMGPFQINASCAENPQIRSSADQLTVSTSELSPRYGVEPGMNAGLAALGIGAAVGGAVLIGVALSDYSTDTGGGSCTTAYLRSCFKSSISGCDCVEFNSAELCQFSETVPGGQCGDSNGFTTALCPSGYSCVNNTCRNDC